MNKSTKKYLARVALWAILSFAVIPLIAISNVDVDTYAQTMAFVMFFHFMAFVAAGVYWLLIIAFD